MNIKGSRNNHIPILIGAGALMEDCIGFAVEKYLDNVEDSDIHPLDGHN